MKYSNEINEKVYQEDKNPYYLNQLCVCGVLKGGTYLSEMEDRRRAHIVVLPEMKMSASVICKFKKSL